MKDLGIYEGAIYHFDKSKKLSNKKRDKEAIQSISSGYKYVEKSDLLSNKGEIRKHSEAAVNALREKRFPEAINYLDDIISIIENEQEKVFNSID